MGASCLPAGRSLVSRVSAHELPDKHSARASLAFLGLLSCGFLLFAPCSRLIPFERLIPAAVDGADLNPLLQDPGLAIHPPLLYIGYVGFSVAFAFAIAAMISGDLDQKWARWTRPWTTVGVAVPDTVGIALGSWWAYYELGWGGWWFWDPVENASFHAVARRHCADSLTGRYRKTRAVQELDIAARDLRFFTQPARHVPGAFGNPGIGARICGRTRSAVCSFSPSWPLSSVVR